MPLRTTTSTGVSSAAQAPPTTKGLGGFSLILSQSATNKKPSPEQTDKNQMPAAQTSLSTAKEEENKDGYNQQDKGQNHNNESLIIENRNDASAIMNLKNQLKD